LTAFDHVRLVGRRPKGISKRPVRSAWSRVAVLLSVVAVLAIGLLGYFSNFERDALVFAGLALLIWLPVSRTAAPVRR
jgi:hypothetical protein